MYINFFGGQQGSLSEPPWTPCLWACICYLPLTFSNILLLIPLTEWTFETWQSYIAYCLVCWHQYILWLHSLVRFLLNLDNMWLLAYRYTVAGFCAEDNKARCPLSLVLPVASICLPKLKQCRTHSKKKPGMDNLITLLLTGTLPTCRLGIMNATWLRPYCLLVIWFTLTYQQWTWLTGIT